MHTPLYLSDGCICDVEHRVVAMTREYPEGKEQVEFILKAANNHAALVAALRRSRQYVTFAKIDSFDRGYETAAKTAGRDLEIIDAALKAAS